MKLFAQKNIQSLIKEKAAKLKNDVKNTESIFLKERNFSTRLEELYQFPIPEIHFDRLTVSVKEVFIPDAKNQEAEIIALEVEYLLPVYGNIEILKHANGSKDEIEVGLITTAYDQWFSLKFISETREPESIVEKQNSASQVIRTHANEIIAAAEKWNEGLLDLIHTEIAAREKTIKQIRSFVSALGVPEYI